MCAFLFFIDICILFKEGFFVALDMTVLVGLNMCNRVSHITPFFELGYTLLTTHALGLYEVTKKDFSVIDSKLTFSEKFLCSTLFAWEKGPK